MPARPAVGGVIREREFAMSGECVNLMVGSEDLDGVDPGAVVGLRIKHERQKDIHEVQLSEQLGGSTARVYCGNGINGKVSE